MFLSKFYSIKLIIRIILMSEADSGCIESIRVQVDIDYIIISTLYIPSIPGESGHCKVTGLVSNDKISCDCWAHNRNVNLHLFISCIVKTHHVSCVSD